MKRHLSLMCVVVLGVLFGFVSCERLTVTEQEAGSERATTAGYPNIQALINATLDEVILLPTPARPALPHRIPRMRRFAA